MEAFEVEWNPEYGHWIVSTEKAAEDMVMFALCNKNWVDPLKKNNKKYHADYRMAKYNSEDWFRLGMMNNYGDEREDLKTIALTEQEGALQTGTRFYEMRTVDGPGGLVVQDPGESVLVLASSAWSKYDRITKKTTEE